MGTDGKVKAINALQLLDDSAGCDQAPGAAYTPGVGDSVDADGNGSYTIAPIVNSGYGDILFRADDDIANEAPATGGPVFDMRDNLTSVTIVDYSTKKMRVAGIDVINDLSSTTLR